MENLEDVAEVSNVCSLATVVLCLIYMVVYIIRVQTEHREIIMGEHLGLGIPVQMMRDVQNPFNLVLHPDKTSSMEDGVWLKLTSRVECQMQLLWGVDINGLYPAIFESWDKFIESVEENRFMIDHCLQRGQITRIEACTDIEIYHPTGEGSQFELGDRPRAVYPLVILLTVPSDQIQWEYPDIVGVVTIVHLSDDVCPGKSHVISQYVRTTNGQPYNLQQLYVSSSDEAEAGEDPELSNSQTGDRSERNRVVPNTGFGNESATSENVHSVANRETETCRDPTEEEDSPNISTCIICQCDRVTVALLPCRHTCVCRDCLRRLNKCPMCRGVIESYFTIDGATGGDTSYQPETTLDDNPSNSPQWWVNLNRRVNEFLGFS